MASAVIVLFISIAEFVLSKIIGKTSSVTMRKAKFLRNMIKVYFKNTLIEGYNVGIIELTRTVHPRAIIDDKHEYKLNGSSTKI